MKTPNEINLAKFFLEVETEYLANQQTIIELEAKQAQLRTLLAKRVKPYPRPPVRPIKQYKEIKQ